MANIYVNLSGSDGGDGSIGNAYGPGDFKTQMTTGTYSSPTFLLKGGATYSDTSWSLSSNISGALTIQKWPGENPPKMVYSGAFSLSIDLRTAFSLTDILVDSVMFEKVSISWDESYPLTGPTFQNCISLNQSIINYNATNNPVHPIYVKGCSFINTQLSILGGYSANPIFVLDTCYFEKSSGNLIFTPGSPSSWSGATIRNCALYGGATFTSDPDAYAAMTTSNNISGNSTQLIDVAVSILNGAFDPHPVNGSPIINAGYSGLGLATDIFGISRTASPDIGAVEAEEVEPGNPLFDVDPEFKSFGIAYRNSTVDQILTVSNDGSSVLFTGPFTGLSAPFYLVDDSASNKSYNPGDSSTVTLRFNPTSLGSFSGTIDMSSNDATPHFIFYVDGTSISSPVNNFSTTPLRGGSPVLSTVDKSSLVDRIQSDSTDTYFDSTTEINRVVVYYNHQDGRQVKRIIHKVDGTNISGSVAWTAGAKDGTWLKNRVIISDADGAEHILNRNAIGNGEDLILL